MPLKEIRASLFWFGGEAPRLDCCCSQMLPRSSLQLTRVGSARKRAVHVWMASWHSTVKLTVARLVRVSAAMGCSRLRGDAREEEGPLRRRGRWPGPWR